MRLKPSWAFAVGMRLLGLPGALSCWLRGQAPRRDSGKVSPREGKTRTWITGNELNQMYKAPAIQTVIGSREGEKKWLRFNSCITQQVQEKDEEGDSTGYCHIPRSCPVSPVQGPVQDGADRGLCRAKASSPLIIPRTGHGAVPHTHV